MSAHLIGRFELATLSTQVHFLYHRHIRLNCIRNQIMTKFQQSLFNINFLISLFNRMVSSTVKLYGRLNLLCLHGQKWTDSIWTRREESCHCHLCRVRHSCLNLRLGRKSFLMGPALTFCSQMVAPLLWTLFPKGSGISTRAIHHTGTRPLIMELLEDSVDEHLPSSFLFFVFFSPCG